MKTTTLLLVSNFSIFFCVSAVLEYNAFCCAENNPDVSLFLHMFHTQFLNAITFHLLKILIIINYSCIWCETDLHHLQNTAIQVHFYLVVI